MRVRGLHSSRRLSACPSAGPAPPSVTEQEGGRAGPETRLCPRGCVGETWSNPSHLKSTPHGPRQPTRGSEAAARFPGERLFPWLLKELRL